MIIYPGTKLTVHCSRKGTYKARASKKIDTEKDEWYEVYVDQDEPVIGLSTIWEKGDSIPCRRGMATLQRRRD